MTIYWDTLDNGDLAIWYWEQDPSVDEPLATQSPEESGWSWTSREAPQNIPPEVMDLCFQAAADYYADVQTVDFTLFRYSMEVACEQIEPR